MRILFLLTQDIESPSGLGRYFPLAKELTRLGHQVSLAALHSNFDDLIERHFVKDGVEVYYVGQMHVQKQGNQKTYFSPVQLIWISLQAIWVLSKAAFTIPSEIIHIGKPHPMNSLAGLIAGFFKGKRLILDCDDFEAGSGKFAGRWQKLIVAYFERLTPRLVRAITTNTHFMRQKLISWGIPERKIFYIPNGVDRSRFGSPDPGEINELRNQLGLSGKKVIAYIGSMSLASHSIDLLIDSFARIYQTRPDARLLLVGGGDDFEKLHQLVIAKDIAQVVHFVGRIAPDRVVNYYYLADVSVDPVRDDDAARGRSPLKLFESWACGIPFVSANVGDREELAGDPPAALLVKPGDVNLLTDAILEVIADSMIAVSLSQNGTDRVNQYLWENLVASVVQIYQNTNIAD